MKKGLGYIGIGRKQQAKMSVKAKVEEFKAHYGFSPLVIADIWHDLCNTSIKEARLEEKETHEKGFKRYIHDRPSLRPHCLQGADLSRDQACQVRQLLRDKASAKGQASKEKLQVPSEHLYTFILIYVYVFFMH
jgi:hypothetical protein